jgi:hypothetical protein
LEEPQRNEERLADDALLDRLNQRVAKLVQEFEKFNIAEYLILLNNPRRFFWINFLGGVARGLGVALGATVVAAILLSILQRVVVLNLPIIGDYIAEIVRIVQDQMR